MLSPLFDVKTENYPEILPADILVSETLDSSLIGEGFISSLCDAKTRGLITQNATIIPARATVWIQLVETTLSLPIPALLGDGDLNFELLREFRPILSWVRTLRMSPRYCQSLAVSSNLIFKT